MAVRPKRALFQTGMSNYNWDRRYSAKFPGRRISKTGKTYYEYRMNRSDMSRSTRV